MQWANQLFSPEDAQMLCLLLESSTVTTLYLKTERSLQNVCRAEHAATPVPNDAYGAIDSDLKKTGKL